MQTTLSMLFSFDVEWIPDPKSAEVYIIQRLLMGHVLKLRIFLKPYGRMREKRETKDDEPYLKTILCRIVSLAGILREKPRMAQN